MTREEQILNNSIDYSFIEDNFLEYDDCGDICDDKDFIQRAFEAGAKWADATMIEKACEWLGQHHEDYYQYDAWGGECVNLTTLIQDFKKAMGSDETSTL